jgi:UDP-N-acetylmuramate dehydrogenase
MFVSPQDMDAAGDIILKARESGVPVLVVGDGTNLIVSDRGISGVVMNLTRIPSEISVAPDTNDSSFMFVQTHAGAKTSTLCLFAARNGLDGMNFAVGIPGTVGGAVAMNAGTHLGSMESVIHSVRVLNGNNRMRDISREELRFSYRTLEWPDSVNKATFPVIMSVRFRLRKGDAQMLESEAHELLKKRNMSQPVSLPNAGCIFKNPQGSEPAGKLIDMAGLKGKTIGGARISEKHANFIVNSGNASASDIISLISLAEHQVRDRFGVVLEKEVKIVGEET